MSKQDIFALYCNEVYLGQRGAVGVRGVKQAARVYFGKELKDISWRTRDDRGHGPGTGGATHPCITPTRLKLAGPLSWKQWSVMGGLQNNRQAAPQRSRSLCPPLKDVASVAPYFVDYVDRVSDQYNAQAHAKGSTHAIDLDLQRLAEKALRQQFGAARSSYKGGAANRKARWSRATRRPAPYWRWLAVATMPSRS